MYNMAVCTPERGTVSDDNKYIIVGIPCNFAYWQVRRHTIRNMSHRWVFVVPTSSHIFRVASHTLVSHDLYHWRSGTMHRHTPDISVIALETRIMRTTGTIIVGTTDTHRLGEPVIPHQTRSLSRIVDTLSSTHHEHTPSSLRLE